ncbi:hypothetical protein ACRALDRAFT_1080023 [Sodiomyces alcalophilus JCM 7366]|uniref:uncharacterized protein n=1 Tax=Sodiomyces alcalophilus JCM 7366 TaxID=591952 RepID=UPI0039B3DCE9
MRLSLFYAPLFARALLAKPLKTRQQYLKGCVENVFGDNAADRIVTPDDETYTDARIGEAIQDEQLPALIAFAQHKDEVGPLINCAKSHGVQPVPRSGGHHFLSYSALTDSLVIDISHIDHVQISEDGDTATVGAGIRLGALYTALHAARGGTADGFDWPGGICPTVGLSGYLASGGFGMQMRAVGLGVDSVISAQVVLATGCRVTASFDENPDLFWAIRGGGGGSYGVVVEWTLALREYPRSSMVLMRWNEDENANTANQTTRAQVAKTWHSWAPRADPALTSQLLIYQHSVEFLGWCFGCAEDTLRSIVTESGLSAVGAPEVHYSAGCGTNAARAVGYLSDVCPPDEMADMIAPYALNTIQQPFEPLEGFPAFAWDQRPQAPELPTAMPWPRDIRFASSYFVQKDQIPEDDVIDELVGRLDLLDPAGAPFFEWHAWNISVSGDSAFPWREQAYSHLEIVSWGSEDEEAQDELGTWFEDTEAFLRPVVGSASYAGYMDTRISTPPLESYYGSNVAELGEIKKKYDRRNVFTNPLAIGPL